MYLLQVFEAPKNTINAFLALALSCPISLNMIYKVFCVTVHSYIATYSWKAGADDVYQAIKTLEDHQQLKMKSVKETAQLQLLEK